MVSCIIPGPKKYKNIDSFLYPLVEELQQLHIGIPRVFNKVTKANFVLRAWLILVSGDGPASADAIGLVTPGNAKRPCHHCYIQGVQGSKSKTYYVPTQNQKAEDLEPRFNLKAIIERWDQLDNKNSAKTKIGSLYGITRKSILIDLVSLHFPRSFPIDPFHCFLLNIMPSLFKLWGGGLKNDQFLNLQRYNKRNKEGPQTEESLPAGAYVLPQSIWADIGAICKSSRSTIPVQLGDHLPDISRHSAAFKAKEWEAFLIRDAVVLLSSYPDFEPYLRHLIVLKEIYQLASLYTITLENINLIYQKSKAWVFTFEDLYYQGRSDRLLVCGINIHSVTHMG